MKAEIELVSILVSVEALEVAVFKRVLVSDEVDSSDVSELVSELADSEVEFGALVSVEVNSFVEKLVLLDSRVEEDSVIK